MSKFIEVKLNNGQTHKVMPRWRGKNLAVHAPIIDGQCQRRKAQWVITHLQSGYLTGGYFYGQLHEAILAARLWDEHFSTATPENARRWPLREQWTRIIRQGKAERPWRPLRQVEEILARA